MCPRRSRIRDCRARQADTRNTHTEFGIDQNNTWTQSRYAAFWERHMGDPQRWPNLTIQRCLGVARQPMKVSKSTNLVPPAQSERIHDRTRAIVRILPIEKGKQNSRIFSLSRTRKYSMHSLSGGGRGMGSNLLHVDQSTPAGSMAVVPDKSATNHAL
jgi:hypothetical protein